jgi:hypothetical protein
MQGFIESEAGNGQLKEERLALGKALGELQQILGVSMGWLGAARAARPASCTRWASRSRRMLLALGDVLVAWLLLRQAEAALRALGADVSPADRHFYEGKVAAARFFVREVLPRIGADRRVIENTTLDVMDLAEEAF